ncbi:hypothetical protein [Pseudoduganella sp. R-34]
MRKLLLTALLACTGTAHAPTLKSVLLKENQNEKSCHWQLFKNSRRRA